MNENEKLWHGAFGEEYHKRNEIQPRITLWEGILKHLDPRPNFAAELGCGKGENLFALYNLGVRDLFGIEINPLAARIASRSSGATISEGAVLDHTSLGTYDLAFTRGFLIHVPEEQLNATLNLLGTARKHVVIIEYDDVGRREIDYRGESGALWADDFAGRFLRLQAEKGAQWELKTTLVNAADGTTTHIFTKVES